MFTAQERGESIDVNEYSQFLLSNLSWLKDHIYVNVDVIDRDHLEDAAQRSLQNWRFLRSQGLNPMAGVHAGEGLDPLRTYLDEGADYIGIGGSGWGNPTEAVEFYDECFNIIAKCGRPIKTHGFAIARYDTLRQFPFSSSDATTWIDLAQVYKGTYLGRLGGREWISSLDDAHTPLEGGGEIRNNELYCAGTYLEALNQTRLEAEIRELPGRQDFNYYLVFSHSNPWAFAAFKVSRHRNGMVSYYYHKRQGEIDIIRRFIEDADAVLEKEQRFSKVHEITKDMQQRYVHRRLGRRWYHLRGKRNLIFP